MPHKKKTAAPMGPKAKAGLAPCATACKKEVEAMRSSVRSHQAELMRKYMVRFAAAGGGDLMAAWAKKDMGATATAAAAMLKSPKFKEALVAFLSEASSPKDYDLLIRDAVACAVKSCDEQALRDIRATFELVVAMHDLMRDPELRRVLDGNLDRATAGARAALKALGAGKK